MARTILQTFLPVAYVLMMSTSGLYIAQNTDNNTSNHNSDDDNQNKCSYEAASSIYVNIQSGGKKCIINKINFYDFFNSCVCFIG